MDSIADSEGTTVWFKQVVLCGTPYTLSQPLCSKSVDVGLRLITCNVPLHLRVRLDLSGDIRRAAFSHGVVPPVRVADGLRSSIPALLDSDVGT